MSDPSAPVPSPEEVMRARLRELQDNRARREREAEGRQAEHELQCLELEEKYTQDLGPRGQEFDLVNEDNACGEGPIVLKPVDTLKYKAWLSKAGAAPEDMHAYVIEGVVYPDRAKFNAITSKRPEILARCVAVMNKLLGFSDAETKKK